MGARHGGGDCHVVLLPSLPVPSSCPASFVRAAVVCLVLFLGWVLIGTAYNYSEQMLLVVLSLLFLLRVVSCCTKCLRHKFVSAIRWHLMRLQTVSWGSLAGKDGIQAIYAAVTLDI